MYRKRILTIFLIVILLFSVVGCSNNKTETLEKEVNVTEKKDNEIDFWDIRKEVESAKVFESHRRIIMNKKDDSQDMAIEVQSKNNGNKKDSVVTIKSENVEYSGNIITMEDYSYVEVELLNELLYNTFFSYSEEDTENMSEMDKQLKRDIENIYVESFFDGINKKYVQSTEDVMPVEVDMTINFTGSESLLELVDLYDSKLISKNGSKYSFKLTKEILVNEIEGIANLLKKDTKTYVPIVYNLLCDFEGLLNSFDESSKAVITIADVKEELSFVMSGKTSYDDYTDKLERNTGNLRNYLNNLITILPEITLTCDITKEDNIYNSIVVYTVEQNGELMEELKLNETVTILDSIDINSPEDYNTIDEFMNTPYYAFSQGDLDALLNTVDKKMREKYGADYDKVMEMLNSIE